MHHSVHTSGVLRPDAAARVDRRLDTEIVDCGLDCGRQQTIVKAFHVTSGSPRSSADENIAAVAFSCGPACPLHDFGAVKRVGVVGLGRVNVDLPKTQAVLPVRGMSFGISAVGVFGASINKVLVRPVIWSAWLKCVPLHAAS
jgi:hypothetical protein